MQIIDRLELLCGFLWLPGVIRQLGRISEFIEWDFGGWKKFISQFICIF